MGFVAARARHPDQWKLVLGDVSLSAAVKTVLSGNPVPRDQFYSSDAGVSVEERGRPPSDLHVRSSVQSIPGSSDDLHRFCLVMINNQSESQFNFNNPRTVPELLAVAQAFEPLLRIYIRTGSIDLIGIIRKNEASHCNYCSCREFLEACRL